MTSDAIQQMFNDFYKLPQNMTHGILAKTPWHMAVSVIVVYIQ